MSKSILSISDEAFLEMENETDSDNQREEEIQENHEDGSDVADDQNIIDEPEGDDQDDINNEEDNDAETEDANADIDDESSETENNHENESIDEDTENVNESDYQTLHDEVFAPLVVSGRTIKPRSIEHLRALAQQGANSSRNLNQIKPYKRIAKTLEKANLFGSKESEAKLNLLIEANQGSPDAIKQLIAEHEIDVTALIDFEEEDNEYVPANHILGNDEIELQDTIDQLRRSQHYTTLVTEVNTFDEESKKALYENPSNLRALHDDLKSGAYHDVMDEMFIMRSNGSLPKGLSSLDEYIYVAKELYQDSEEQQKPTVKKVTKKKRLSNKKSMANTSTSKQKQQKRKIVNPLSMSDDDFLKLE